MTILETRSTRHIILGIEVLLQYFKFTGIFDFISVQVPHTILKSNSYIKFSRTNVSRVAVPNLSGGRQYPFIPWEEL